MISRQREKLRDRERPRTETENRDRDTTTEELGTEQICSERRAGQIRQALGCRLKGDLRRGREPWLSVLEDPDALPS